MQPVSFKRHRFPPDVIRLAVWLYFRFTLSIRDLEEMLAQRGIDAASLRFFPAAFLAHNDPIPGLARRNRKSTLLPNWPRRFLNRCRNSGLTLPNLFQLL